jgi:hypothetical protein
MAWLPRESEVPGPDRAARPDLDRPTEVTDFARQPRSIPTGFSRGQVRPVGRLHTASRGSQAIPTALRRDTIVKLALPEDMNKLIAQLRQQEE